MSQQMSKPPKSDRKAFNAWAEAKFQVLVRQMIKESGHEEVRLSSVKANCAYEIDVSVITVGRYIRKYCAQNGPFRLGMQGFSIGLNPDFRKSKAP
jgi:hypothetical protein